MTDREPRFVRIAHRPRLSTVLPVCDRCGTLLRGNQTRFCSPSCRVLVSQAKRDLDRYWITRV